MTKELKNQYLNEINYQKHMIDNLKRWFTLSFLVATIAITLMYFFHSNLASLIFCIIVTIIGLLATFIFGLGIYRGQQNVNKVIDEFATLSRSNSSL